MAGRTRENKVGRRVKLINAIDAGDITVVNNAQIFAANGTNSLLAETPAGTREFEYQKLIIATGARERFLPFPGWTLPNVFGAGGLQALVKGGLKVENKSIVVAGTGPLLLAVAEYLKSKGANVVAICEQASGRKDQSDSHLDYGGLRQKLHRRSASAQSFWVFHIGPIAG